MLYIRPSLLTPEPIQDGITIFGRSYLTNAEMITNTKKIFVIFHGG